MESYSGPGSIQIDSVVLSNYDGSKSIDISPILLEFNIHESMTRPFVTASFVINDSLALNTQFPIIGQETIVIKFKTPSNAFLKWIEMVFRVVAIKEYKRENIREATYVLNCVTPAMIKDMNTKIRKAWLNKPIHEMVTDIVSGYLGEEMKFTDPTEGERTIVIPNLSPSDACLFLARQAKSVNYLSSAYFFYQNCDGFYFRTSDDIINPAHKTSRNAGRSLDKYYASDFDFSKGISPRDAASGAGGGAQQSSKPYEHLKINSFIFHNYGNYYRGMQMGFLENKVHFFDPATSFYEEKVYKYMENDNIFQKTSQSQSSNFLTPQNDYIMEGHSLVLFEPTNHLQTNDYANDQSYDVLQNKIGSKFIFENVNATVSIPGDSEKRCGDVIDLQFPEYGATDDVEGKINKFISGEYLILSVRHIYNAAGYETVMNVSKNAYENEIERVAENYSTSTYDENKTPVQEQLEEQREMRKKLLNNG